MRIQLYQCSVQSTMETLVNLTVQLTVDNSILLLLLHIITGYIYITRGQINRFLVLGLTTLTICKH